jgi:hypothetical protein
MDHTTRPSFLDQIGMEFPFPIHHTGSLASQVYLVKVKVQHRDQFPLFIPKLEKFEEKYNELLGEKGTINTISGLKFKDTSIEFLIDAGSAHPVRVFRALLFILLDIDTMNQNCIQEILIESM